MKFTPSDEMDLTVSWKPTFVAITDKDFLLYDAAPSCKDEWVSPVHSHSILATRFALHLLACKLAVLPSEVLF